MCLIRLRSNSFVLSFETRLTELAYDDVNLTSYLSAEALLDSHVFVHEDLNSARNVHFLLR